MKSSRFTLTEFLIVTTIVLVLISFAIPSLSRALIQAQVGQCMSNKKQVAMAELTYQDDFFNWHVPYRSPSSGNWVQVLNRLYIHHDPVVFTAIPGNLRAERGGIYDCPLYVVRYNQWGYLGAANAAGAIQDIAISGALHGMYGSDGFSRTAHDWTGGPYVSLKPTDSDIVRKEWTIRKASQLVSVPDSVPHFTDGTGAPSPFNQLWRTFFLATHGTSSLTSRVVIWADMHGSIEEFGFSWNNY